MSNMTKPIVLDETGQRIAAALEQMAEATRRVTLTISMVGTNGEQVHDESVIVTNAITGNVMYNVPYIGQPIEIQLAQDTVYAITGTQENLAVTKFYAPSTVNGVAQSDTNVEITYQVLDAANSLLALHEAVAANPGKEIIPIGTEVTLPWTDEQGKTYDWPWAVVHYKYVLEEKNKDTGRLTWGMILTAKECNNVNLPFDEAETEPATEATADGSLYYYGKKGTTYELLALSQGDAVPYADYDAVYHNEIKDTTCNIIRYGYNRYAHSAVRQYIKSEAGIGGWWQAMHVGDTAPKALNSAAGLLHGFRAEDVAAMASTAVVTALNAVTDAGMGELETVFDKMFLPSIKEIYGVEQASGEGDSWDAYWNGIVGLGSASNDANGLRRIFAVDAKTSAQTCRLRSAHRGNSYSAWYVAASGSLNDYRASNASRCAPACVIC